MSAQDIERILDEITELRKDMTEMKVKVEAHCAIEQKSPTWKTYLIFLISGAVIGWGPQAIPVIEKLLGIGG